MNKQPWYFPYKPRRHNFAPTGAFPANPAPSKARPPPACRLGKNILAVGERIGLLGLCDRHALWGKAKPLHPVPPKPNPRLYKATFAETLAASASVVRWATTGLNLRQCFNSSRQCRVSFQTHSPQFTITHNPLHHAYHVAPYS